MAPLRPDRESALAASSIEIIRLLSNRDWCGDVYLAGSAALSLYLAQRQVRDLDLMSSSNRLQPPQRRDLLADLLAIDPQTVVETARNGFLYVRTGTATAIRFYYYPYPLIDPLEEYRGMAVISAMDMALMKMGAIISRGSKRDFVDLYLLCQHLPLATILDRAKEKFGHVRDFPLQALKGLADTSLAIDEPMPVLDVAVEWEDIERWIREEVRTLGREYVGLSGAGGK
jgi:hypothetical protein